MSSQIAPQTSVFFNRDDTFFGVCEAIGQDFGFTPLWLRLALAVPMAVYPLVWLGIYAVLGTAVLASRMIAPETQRTEPLKATEPQPVSVLQNSAEPPFELPLAA